jgi:hypothetical protein
MAGRTEIDLQRVEPKLFGRVSPLGLLGTGGVLFLAGIALALADWVLGSLLLVLALLVLGLYAMVAHRRPQSPLARRAVDGVWKGRDELRFARAFAGAWARAEWRVGCLERERRTLRRQRDAAQHEFGGAVYADDHAAAERLRERMRALDAEIAACAERIEQVRLEARGQVDRARAPLRATEVTRPQARS